MASDEMIEALIETFMIEEGASPDEARDEAQRAVDRRGPIWRCWNAIAERAIEVGL